MNRMLIAGSGIVACRGHLAAGHLLPAGQSRDDEQPPSRPRRTRGQDVERAIRGNYLRAAWRPETSVLRTPVCQHHEQPICDKLEHGIRPERTSVVGSGAWLPTKLFPKRAHLREIGTSPQPEAP